MKIQLIEKTIKEYKENGLTGVFSKILFKIKKNTFYTTKSIWFLRNLDKEVYDFEPDIDVTCCFCEEDKSEIIKWIIDNKEKYPWIYIEKEILNTIDNKHLFFVIKHKRSIIGYVKVGYSLNYIHDFDQCIRFPDKASFIYDTFVEPEYRGKKLALYSLNNIILHLRQRHYRHIFCHIEKWNAPSLKVFNDAGFEKFDQIRYVRIFNIPFFLNERHRPFRCLESYLLACISMREDPKLM